MASDFLPVGQALALIDVEQAHIGDELLVDAARRLQQRLGRQRRIDHEGEIALDRLERRQLQQRPGLPPWRAASGTASRNTSKPAAGPFTSSASKHAGMDLAEMAPAASAPGAACRRGRGGTRRAHRPRAGDSSAATPAASSAASASALASKTHRPRAPGSSQRLAPVRAGAHARRRPGPGPAGVSSRYCGPISKSAPSAKPRSALRRAASSRLGRIEGRITSRSALIGLSSVRLSGAAAEQRRLLPRT